MAIDINKRRANARARYAANPAHYRAKRNRWVLLNPHKRRRSAGLPEPTRDIPERCELCGNPPGKRALHLDHCHVSGKFRGWLCHHCNLGLGNFKDNPVVLQKAVEWVK